MALSPGFFVVVLCVVPFVCEGLMFGPGSVVWVSLLVWHNDPLFVFVLMSHPLGPVCWRVNVAFPGHIHLFTIQTCTTQELAV